MQWYPGDDYVDWWAINIYGLFGVPGVPGSNAGIGSPYVLQFIEAAVEKDYAVMIGDSDPRSMDNGCANSSAWELWYQPYFSMINNKSLNIRSFCYGDFGDSGWWNYPVTIQSPNCSDVGSKYAEAIAISDYMNAMDRASTERLLGIV